MRSRRAFLVIISGRSWTREIATESAGAYGIEFAPPCDPEAYVHWIGRTGRARRKGKANLFVTPRQQRLLHDIQRYVGQRLTPLKLPTKADVAARHMALFKESIRKTLAEGDLELYLSVVEALAEEGLELAGIATWRQVDEASAA
jgi:superfamily II DNA/RNA helicase